MRAKLKYSIAGTAFEYEIEADSQESAHFMAAHEVRVAAAAARLSPQQIDFTLGGESCGLTYDWR